MPRYFIEVSYRGTNFAGFQTQDNARTIQGEVERALAVLLRETVKTTGSSRTDAGVHAFQNYLHFDTSVPLIPHFCYKLNAILVPDVAVRSVCRVSEDAHARFDAVSRAYSYRLYSRKNPFLRGCGYFFPYPLDEAVLHEAASMVLTHQEFESFSKRNTQVRTFRCTIEEAAWHREEGELVFDVRANRFLRGMVRGLVGTMLKVGRGRISLTQFQDILQAADNRETDFSVPPQGLFLTEVRYPANFFWGESHKLIAGE